ncbi:TetR/AcrR family transcriptional regulator [Corynebacterium testudinoris]|uniref:Transcriptional regulator, TetR family n=1 Tax=Corynebacterium testudinoris TaxID=136857 RepID=A0A0G3HAB3_9CORY|nr:TetR family transcriptional regulator [Corynebacterium testudinoris]AKK09675.1 transcriptional regulator, TetR family [Corynebacterium testudinoris]MBX8996320.1 TetR/AcrR family transcriptional regulator [Corynebacterium testudinoris]
MHSVSEPSDLTGRARIRDAAIELFAERGFHKTSVKAIAESAGVSPGLVIHHFGSKDELRRVCDEYVIAKLIDERFASAETPSADLVQALLAEATSAGPKFSYLARLLVEPGKAGDELFTRLVASTERNLALGRETGSIMPASDPEATAMLVTVFGISQFLVRDRFAQALGADPFSAEGAARLTLPTLEIFTEGLYANSELLTAARNALAGQSEAVPDEGKGSQT